MPSVPKIQAGVTAAVLAITIPSTAQADLGQEIEAMFDNTLANTTAPQASMGQRRGVVSGGSLYLRNRIITPNIVSTVPPSFSAGCGGIDLFGGSFSFINAQQFTQLLRSIAQNAVGYAFPLAIEAMCPSCAQLMQKLQDTVQKMNLSLNSSCQLAQGLVTDVETALKGKQRSDEGLYSQVSGAVTDVFEGFTDTTGSTPAQNARSVNPAQAELDLSGNILWKALKRANAETWFGFGDDALLEAIMSMTGSVIIGDMVPTASGPPEPEVKTIEGGLLTIRDLVFGTSTIGVGPPTPINVYRCDTSDLCKNPTLQTDTLTGLEFRIRQILGGGGALGQSLLANLVNNLNPSQEQLAFMSLAPAPVAAMIHNLVGIDRQLARTFVRDASSILAVELVRRMMHDLIQAASRSMAHDSSPYASPVLDMLSRAAERTHQEYIELSAAQGTIYDLIERYQQVVRLKEQRRYVHFSAGTGGR